MRRNITFLWLGFLVLLLFQVQSEGYAQSSATITSDSSSVQTQLKPQWTIGLNVTTLGVFFLGGYAGQNGHFGLNIKRISGPKAIRFSASVFPQVFADYYNLSNSIPIEIQGQNVVYRNQNINGTIVRAGIGFERGWKSGKRGRRNVGCDLSVNMLRGYVQSYEIIRNLESREIIEWPLTIETKSYTSIGPGISPFVGYEFHAWKRLGFNLELKADLTAFFGDPIGFDQNGNMVRHRIFYDMRMFPLAEFRMHYRLWK
jgi:hypothetical protein